MALTLMKTYMALHSVRLCRQHKHNVFGRYCHSLNVNSLDIVDILYSLLLHVFVNICLWRSLYMKHCHFLSCISLLHIQHNSLHSVRLYQIYTYNVVLIYYRGVNMILQDIHGIQYCLLHPLYVSIFRLHTWNTNLFRFVLYILQEDNLHKAHHLARLSQSCICNLYDYCLPQGHTNARDTLDIRLM